MNELIDYDALDAVVAALLESEPIRGLMDGTKLKPATVAGDVSFCLTQVLVAYQRLRGGHCECDYGAMLAAVKGVIGWDYVRFTYCPYCGLKVRKVLDSENEKLH